MLLTRAGLDKRCLPRAVRYFCFAYNSSRTGLDGKPTSKSRHGYPLGGTTPRFGALMHYLPLTRKGMPGADKLSPSMRRAILARYLMHPGGL